MRKLSLLDMMVVMGAAQFDSLWMHAKLLQSGMEKGRNGWRETFTKSEEARKEKKKKKRVLESASTILHHILLQPTQLFLRTLLNQTETKIHDKEPLPLLSEVWLPQSSWSVSAVSKTRYVKTQFSGRKSYTQDDVWV